jgi:CheY-like chemotaxis protein
LHFNRKRVVGSNHDTVSNNNTINQNLLLIDNLKLDDHLRITFTKRIRNIFAVETGDTIEVSQNLKNNIIIFIVKRRDAVIDSWICKKRTGNEVDNKSDTDIYIDDKAFHTTPAHFRSMLSRYEVPSYQLTNITHTDIIESNSSSFDDNTTTYTTDTRRPSNNTSMKTIPKVMIVDDDQDILLTFKTILNDNGIDAETFANSPEALICLAEAEPSYFDLVILDIKMQDINGFELYKIMNAMTRGASTVTNFLFISALEYAEESINLLPGVKPKDILKKPIKRESLMAKINQMLVIK